MTHGYGNVDWWESGMEPGDNDYVLRQSNLGNMDLCQGRVGLMMDRDPLPPSEAMWRGTCAHWWIDLFIDLWLDGEQDFSTLHDVTWVLNSLIELAREKDGFDFLSRFSSPQAVRAWVTDVISLGNAWVEQWLLARDNHLIVEQAIDREIKLLRPLGTIKVPGTREPVRAWISGHPDLFEADRVVDWKTSSRNWSKGKAFGMSQDDVYAALIEWNYPVQIDSGLFVVGDATKNQWHEHHTKVTKASKEAAMQRAFRHIQSLLTETWSYTPTGAFGDRHWPCRPNFCPAWDICPAKYLADSYDNEPIQLQGVWR
jgi:hypothetical protein